MSDADSYPRRRKKARKKNKVENFLCQFAKKTDSDDVVNNGSGEDCDKSEKPEDYKDEESIWEVSDFSSSDDSFDEWLL
eukprot:gene5343-515_t